MELILGIDVACRAAHQASLARADGTFVWTGRRFFTKPDDLERLWAACGLAEGDTLRMMPGGYFSLIFATVEATGATRHDEVRVEPHDGKWRVVGYVRTTP